MTLFREGIEFLLGKGADIDAKDSDGMTPLHFAVCNGNLEMVKFLVKEGADFDLACKGKTVLDLARSSESENKEEVIKFFEEEVKIREKYTPLHYAILSDNSKTLKLLLKQERFINAQDSENCTPLGLAIEKSKLKAVNLLLDHKAFVDFGHLRLAIGKLKASSDAEKIAYLLVGKLKEELDKTKAQFGQGGGNLASQVEELELRLETTEAELTKKEKELKGAQVQLETKEIELKKQGRVLEKLQIQKAGLKKKIERLMKAKTELEDQLTKEKKALANVQVELTKKEEEKSQLEKKLNSTQQDLAKRTSEVTTLTKENAQLKNEIEITRKTSGQKDSQIFDLESNITELNEQLRNKKGQIEYPNNQLKGKDGQVKELSNENTKLSKVNTQSRKQITYASISFVLSGAFAVGASLTMFHLAVCITLSVAALTFLAVGCYCSYKANTALSNVEVKMVVDHAVKV